jgi:hypothetical protein
VPHRRRSRRPPLQLSPARGERAHRTRGREFKSQYPSLRAQAKQSISNRLQRWIASSLSLPCANALRLSQAMTSARTSTSPRCASRPGYAAFVSRQTQRAQGMPGARCAPAASRAKTKKHTSVVTTVTPVSPGIPRANGFNGFLRALPGESGFVVTVAGNDAKHRRQLDASVEASGPHDFAVRFSRVRLVAPKRPPHPAPNVRDDRETPLVRARDGGEYGFDLGESESGKFLR